MVFVPCFNIHVSDVEVKRLRYHWAGGDGPVRSRGRLVFTMTFEEDAGIDSINLSDGNVVNISYERIEEEEEVFQPAGPAKL